MIESYGFGRIKISGKLYTSDVIVYPDRVSDRWWRNEGHRLSIEDLKDVWQTEPEVLIVGTGYSGLMRVPDEVKKYAVSRKIEFIAESTREAYKTFNRLALTKKTVAALHITC